MPVKKSKPRTATSLRRITKYKETYRAKTVPLWFKKTLPLGAALLEDWLTNQEELELQIYAELAADGIASELYPYYAALGRRCFVKCLNFSSETYKKERASLRNEFVLRGLDSHEVDEVISIADYKCGLVKGILVTLQDIEDKLDNGTYGLDALHDLLDALEAKLDDGTSGLDALKILIDALEAKLDKAKHCMTFLSVIDDVIDLPAAATDTDLPPVVISGLPAGFTLDKVLVFLIVRAIENTSSGGDNAIEGTQYIKIKKSTGDWAIDAINAIQLIDNMWTVKASTREFGDVIGGDDAHDVKSEVDGNATYNLRFEDANVDLAVLRLNDVQVMIKVWYH
jgi:hypothetical protein